MEGEPPAEDITVRMIAMDADATSGPAALALGAPGPAAQAAAAPGAHPDAVSGGQATVDHLPQPPLENRSNDATTLARVSAHCSSSWQEQDTHNVEEVYVGLPPCNDVLISGCQTDETSADATTADGMSYSVLSNAIQTNPRQQRQEVRGGSGDEPSAGGQGAGAAVQAAKQGYTQQLGLYCSDEHARLPFIC